MAKSKIEWTGETWNPFVGCSLVSEGCKNCYAMKMAARLSNISTTPQYKGLTERGANGQIRWNGVTRFVLSSLLQPGKHKKPTTFFVCSMSDLFHESNCFEDIDKVFAVMGKHPHHTFQVLTKRAERMQEYLRRPCPLPASAHAQIFWPLPNVWLGVSVENQAAANERIPILIDTPAAVRFLSCEPLLGPIDSKCHGINLHDGDVSGCDTRCGTLTDCPTCDGKGSQLNSIDWVIVGGESGAAARPMQADWARQIRDDCAKASVPFFFKQWGEYDAAGKKVGKITAGRLLDGKLQSAFPNRAN